MEIKYDAKANLLAAPIPTGWNNDTLLEYLSNCGFSIDTDNEGQVIIYTNLFIQNDGSLRNVPQL